MTARRRLLSTVLTTPLLELLNFLFNFLECPKIEIGLKKIVTRYKSMEAFILMKKQNCSNFLAQINLSLNNGLCEIKDNQKRTMNNRITA